MSLRHVAAFALAGWYLMMPPIGKDGFPDTHAPLREWTIVGSFDSADDCEGTYVRLSNKPQKGRVNKLLVQADTCIATDDPRLAK